MKKPLLSMTILSLAITSLWAKEMPEVIKVPTMKHSLERTEVFIPDIAGFKTVKCDLHAHTIFSDGKFLPDMRVEEAWSDGLDAIAISEHLEYTPNDKFILGDHNKSYDLALKKTKEANIMLIKACEISRQKPFGHMNALFITDANAIFDSLPERSLDKALAQKAVIMWNHPGWPDNKSTIYDMHKQWLQDNKIHAIEVFNEAEYYPPAMGWCKAYKKSATATSDIHAISRVVYGESVRPMTLVFAKEKSLEGIKEGILSARTIALFNGIFVGQKDLLKQLFQASTVLKQTGRTSKGDRVCELTNLSSIPFMIRINEFTAVQLPALKTVRLTVAPTVTVTVENMMEEYQDYLEVVL